MNTPFSIGHALTVKALRKNLPFHQACERFGAMIQMCREKTTTANTVHKQWWVWFKVKVLSFKIRFVTGTVTHNLHPPLLMHKRCA